MTREFDTWVGVIVVVTVIIVLAGKIIDELASLIQAFAVFVAPVIVVIAVVSWFVPVPFFSEYAFFIVVAAYVITADEVRSFRSGRAGADGVPRA